MPKDRIEVELIEWANTGEKFYGHDRYEVSNLEKFENGITNNRFVPNLKEKVEDAITCKRYKVPFLPLYFYWKTNKKNTPWRRKRISI